MPSALPSSKSRRISGARKLAMASWNAPTYPTLLASSKADGCAVDLSDVTYFVGHETVLHREDSKGLPAWQEALFSTMQRNASHVTCAASPRPASRRRPS